MRIGYGYDIHKLTEGRSLILGGVTIPSEKGEAGYSDGDVLIHAVIDALLGASASGDIGDHFPPGNAEFKNIDSTILLERTMKIVRNSGFELINIDCTIILEKPKLFNYKKEIKDNLAGLLKINKNCVSVKAKTKERMDSTGKGEAVESMAACLLEKTKPYQSKEDYWL